MFLELFPYASAVLDVSYFIVQVQVGASPGLPLHNMITEPNFIIFELVSVILILQVPLGPKLLHYIMLLFRINFLDYVIILYITELVSNYFLGYVISCVVTEHTMWASDYITEFVSN